jgi:predicted permease
MPDWKPEIRRRLAGLKLEPTRETAIVEEISQDLDDCYAELLAGGATEAEAFRQTIEELRGSEAMRRELRRVAPPDRRAPQDPFVVNTNRRGKMIADLWQDLRYGARMLWTKPGFTLVAALTLALGIGANTAIFSVTNSVLIKSLSYPEPDRLVQVYESLPTYDRNNVSGGAFKDWREDSSKFARLAIYEEAQLNLTGYGSPERAHGWRVSTEFLSVLGLSPAVGRDFAKGEDTVGGNNRVAMLTNQFWRARFGADPGVIGKVIYLDQIPYTVIGALPPRALLSDDVMFLTPTVIDASGVNWSRAGHFRMVIGRLLPGVTTAEAQADLRAIKQRLTSEYPAFKKDWSVTVIPMQEVFAGDTRPTLRILLGAVALVLLIACANVSNLLLARGGARAREMAIRSALGARASRIIRQVLVESLLLALTGCALGLLFATVGVKFLSGLFADQLPLALRPALDARVLLFSILVACGSGILFGALPAITAGRVDLNRALKESDRGAKSRSKKRAQSFMVVSEFAFTLMLLVGAGLFLRSFMALLMTDPGFNPKRALAFDLSFPRAKYPDLKDRLRFVKDLTGRIAALPGVEAVGASTSLPLSRDGTTEFISRAEQPDRTDYLVGCDFVTGDYFAAMGIRLLQGRALTEADNTEAAPRVLVIDTAVARDLYPGENPIGRSMAFLGGRWEIVGVVSPVLHQGLDAPRPRVYGAQAQALPSTSIVTRTSLPPPALTEAGRNTINDVDPDQPMANIRTMEQAVSKSLAPRRATMELVALFAAIAIGLACVGVYSVMSYAIGQRARELSIRIALGAQRREIIKLVLIDGIKPSIAGIGIGLAAALLLSRSLEKLLFEVRTRDPLVFIAAALLLAVVAVFSIYLPARRAARLDPIAALRNE